MILSSKCSLLLKYPAPECRKQNNIYTEYIFQVRSFRLRCGWARTSWSECPWSGSQEKHKCGHLNVKSLSHITLWHSRTFNSIFFPEPARSSTLVVRIWAPDIMTDTGSGVSVPALPPSGWCSITLNNPQPVKTWCQLAEFCFLIIFLNSRTLLELRSSSRVLSIRSHRFFSASGLCLYYYYVAPTQQRSRRPIWF